MNETSTIWYDKIRTSRAANRIRLPMAPAPAEFQIERQRRLLEAVNSVAFCLFSMEKMDFNKAVAESLEILGRSVHAERVVVWKNYVKNGNLRIFRYAKWNDPDISAVFSREINDPIPGDLAIDEILPNWETIMADQRPVFSIDKQIREPFRSIAEYNGIRSILIIPVFSQGNYWGFISFINYTKKRFYSFEEKELLRTGGALIASAIDIHETTKDLISARDEAQKNTKAKSDFLSMMSHELRTPMNAIIGMADIAKQSPDKREHCLEKIRTSSRQLLGIINDVLDISKIEADKLELEASEFNFEKMLQNINDVIRVKVDEKRQRLVLEGQTIKRMIVGDELRFSQVLLNLLSNAVKFTPEEGNIVVKYEARESGRDNEVIIRMEVKDSGIGMTPLQQKKLFKPFEQAGKDTSRKFGGTGLGLAISKRIINKMGGDIWVESESGNGTSFIFEIKAHWGKTIAKEKAKSNEAPVKPRWQGKTILAVEDVEINREIINLLLEETKITVENAVNGLDAVAKFKENPGKYSLILMDVQMPEMDGLEATRQIRSIEAEQLPESSTEKNVLENAEHSPRLAGRPKKNVLENAEHSPLLSERPKSVPIIAMTASAFTDDVKNCLDAGMNGHVAKPINVNDLYGAMRVFLG